MADAITPFRIETSEAELDDLRRRVRATRYPEAETVEDWSQGAPLAYVKELAAYWADAHDWRRCEAALNALPQFKTDIDGLGIHFLHVRSPEPAARPLIMTHGWPGSVLEFLEVIGPLTDPATHGGEASEAFHVVCPALPGYGYSDKPSATGWGVPKIAEAWDALMRRLGYGAYFAQGGDWGGAVTTMIGVQNKGACKGLHVNMAYVMPDPETMGDLTEAEQSAMKAMEFYQEWDSGYSKQQSTRPQSLGYGLADSPVGQMAWILEKFHRWTDCNDDPVNAVSRDHLLDNITLYWLTNSAASSARLYWESFRNWSMEPVAIPSAMSIFPKEIFRASERWARKRYTDLRYFNTPEKGGHFAALEQPELFVSELRAAFAAMSLD